MSSIQRLRLSIGVLWIIFLLLAIGAYWAYRIFEQKRVLAYIEESPVEIDGDSFFNFVNSLRRDGEGLYQMKRYRESEALDASTIFRFLSRIDPLDLKATSTIEAMARFYLDLGNDAFSRGDYAESMRLYETGLEVALEGSDIFFQLFEKKKILLNGLNQYGLVLYLSFDTVGYGRGVRTYGSSEFRHRGIVHGARHVEGRVGKALKFDGNDDWVEIPDAPSLHLKGRVTLCAWIKFKAGGKGNPRIISKLPDEGNELYGYELFTRSTEKRRVVQFKAGSGLDSEESLKAGTWYFLAGVMDESSLSLYINGTLSNQKESDMNIDPGNRSLSIGRKNVVEHERNVGKESEIYLDDDAFRGIIDEVRIYDRELTEEEIRIVYGMGE